MGEIRSSWEIARERANELGELSAEEQLMQQDYPKLSFIILDPVRLKTWMGKLYRLIFIKLIELTGKQG